MAMKRDPKVSVVLPVYNCDKYLQYSIESILDQTFKDFELLILDDGSTDKSSEIAKRYASKDNRIRYFYHSNIGLTRTLNVGLNISKGTYIARQDADDISHPTRLEKQVEFLDNNPEIVLVGTWYYLINGSGKIIKYNRYPNTHKELSKILIKKRKNVLPHTSIMFKKSIIYKIGNYNPIFKKSQDYDLYLRLLFYNFKIASVPKFLVYYRIHKDSVSHNENFYESRMYALFSLFCYNLRKEKNNCYETKILNSFVEKFINSYVYKYYLYRFTYEKYPLLKKFIYSPKLVLLKFLSLYDEKYKLLSLT